MKKRVGVKKKEKTVFESRCGALAETGLGVVVEVAA